MLVLLVDDESTDGAADVARRACGASAEMRRRSEEKLRGGEELDYLHGSTAKRTLPQRVKGRRRRGGVRCWRMGLLEQARTEWKEFCSPPVSKKSEVADAQASSHECQSAAGGLGAFCEGHVRTSIFT